VIVSSYHESTVDAPEGVVVDTLEVAAYGYISEWITDEELADAAGHEDHDSQSIVSAAEAQRFLVERVEALSGDKLGAFYGCYSMSKIDLGAIDDQ
jgi:hypothetical protein